MNAFASSKNMVGYFLLAALCCMHVTWASTEPARHTVELRITDHKPGIADFQELFVSLESVSFHQAGAGRSDGWHQVYGKTPLIDIVPLKDGLYTSVDVIEIPALKYDAVKIRFSELQTELLTGVIPKVTWSNSTVAADIDLDQHAELAVVIDLYAENQTEHKDGGYVVKVKEVRIED